MDRGAISSGDITVMNSPGQRIAGWPRKFAPILHVILRRQDLALEKMAAPSIGHCIVTRVSVSHLQYDERLSFDLSIHVGSFSRALVEFPAVLRISAIPTEIRAVSDLS